MDKSSKLKNLFINVLPLMTVCRSLPTMMMQYLSWVTDILYLVLEVSIYFDSFGPHFLQIHCANLFNTWNFKVKVHLKEH